MWPLGQWPSDVGGWRKIPAAGQGPSKRTEFFRTNSDLNSSSGSIANGNFLTQEVLDGAWSNMGQWKMLGLELDHLEGPFQPKPSVTLITIQISASASSTLVHHPTRSVLVQEVQVIQREEAELILPSPGEG